MVSSLSMSGRGGGRAVHDHHDHSQTVMIPYAYTVKLVTGVKFIS